MNPKEMVQAEWPKAARHCDCERGVSREQRGGLGKSSGTATDIRVPNLLTEGGEGGEGGKNRKNKRRKSEYDNDDDDDDDERLKNNFEVSRLHHLFSSPNVVRVIKSRRMRWAGHVARMGEEREAYRVLVGKPEGKRPLGRPRRRWVDNIRMDFWEVGCGYVDWIGLAQDRDRWRTLVSAVMNLRVP